MRPSAEMSDMMKIPGLDKIAHAGIFGIFSSLILWSLVGSITKRDWLLALLISSFYGFGLECVQKISFTNRNFDYYDIIANIIGAIIGATILIIVKKKTYE